MKLRIFLILLLTFIITNSLWSQTKDFSNILPKGIEARPLLDSFSYLPDTLKQSTIDVLKSKGFNLTECFVDKRITLDEKRTTIFIRIWNIEDLKCERASEKSRKIIPYHANHFYSGTIEFDMQTKTAKFIGDQ